MFIRLDQQLRGLMERRVAGQSEGTTMEGFRMYVLPKFGFARSHRALFLNAAREHVASSRAQVAVSLGGLLELDATKRRFPSRQR
jgi:hypothetical protein